jgi:hypothetical protein
LGKEVHLREWCVGGELLKAFNRENKTMPATNEQLRKKLQEQEAHIRNQDKLISSLAKSVEEMQRKALGVTPAPSKQQPVNYLDYVSMSPEALRDLARAVPDRMVSDILRDNRASPVEAAEPSKPVKMGSGWQEPTPLSAPPGIELADRLVDAQDARDKVEMVRRLVKETK